MEVFKNIFEKKSTDNSNEDNTSIIGSENYMEKVEMMEKVVSAGIEKEDFAEMNQKLIHICPQEEYRESYIFEHPGVKRNIVAIVICLFFSINLIYFLFIGGSTAYFSTQYMAIGSVIAGSSLILLFINILLIIKSVSEIRYRYRFNGYCRLLKLKNIEIIDYLAQNSHQKKSIVIKDLRKAVEKKLIPQGHFSKNNIAFMMSHDVYMRYMQNQATYDYCFNQQIEENYRIKKRTRKMNDIMEMGNQYIKKIHDSNIFIKDKAVSKNLDRMEAIVSGIFHEVDVNPSLVNSLGMFLNYYLPTTEKLLEAYISIGEKSFAKISLLQTQKEIESSLEIIIQAYENILEKLYEEQKMDISSDIATIKLMIKQEGLSD